MNLMCKNNILYSQIKLIFRRFSCTPVMETAQWRTERGLPSNRNAEGVLTDTPDYTFLDGRPTPLLHGQKHRILKQQQFATTIVELSGELDFAKKRHQDILKAKDEERQHIINNRLKPKGNMLLKKK